MSDLLWQGKYLEVRREGTWEFAARVGGLGAAVILATTAAHDPLLTRRALSSLRSELGPPAVPWEAALAMERGVQTWSMRRRFDETRRA